MNIPYVGLASAVRLGSTLMYESYVGSPDMVVVGSGVEWSRRRRMVYQLSWYEWKSIGMLYPVLLDSV